MANPTRDIHIYESGNGGDLAVLNNDISLTEKLYQSIYLSLFGGNIQASTRGDELPERERFDWWGNSLLFSDRPNKQFNSNTERVLSSVALNSSGRMQIISAVSQDLEYLRNIVGFEISVSMPSTDRVLISILLTDTDQELNYIWDNARQEVIIDRTI